MTERTVETTFLLELVNFWRIQFIHKALTVPKFKKNVIIKIQKIWNYIHIHRLCSKPVAALLRAITTFSHLRYVATRLVHLSMGILPHSSCRTLETSLWNIPLFSQSNAAALTKGPSHSCSLPWLKLFFLVAQFGLPDSSRKHPSCSKKNSVYGFWRLLCLFWASVKYKYIFFVHWFVSCDSPVSEVLREFFFTSDMQCQLWDLYITFLHNVIMRYCEF